MLKLKPTILASSVFIVLGLILLPGSALAASCNDNTQAGIQSCLKTNPLTNDINTIIDVLGAGVGIVVTAMIIVGGIQYAIAGDNPQRLSEARKRIINALIALFVFMFIFAFVQWLVPGGIF